MTKEELLEQDGSFIQPIVGMSMMPMLRMGKDVVLVKKKTGRLSVLDVALYKRADGAYILHRVFALTDDGYLIRGDNTYETEVVAESSVIGVLEGFYRGEKYVPCTSKRYLRYVKRRMRSYPVRRLWFRFRRWLSKVKRSIQK